MRQPHVLHKLPLWIGGDLSAEECAEIQRHLDQCDACRIETEAYRASQAWVKEWAAPPFDEADRARLRQKVMAQVRSEPPGRTVSRAPWIGLAAALVLALVGEGIHGRLRDRPPVPSQAALSCTPSQPLSSGPQPPQVVPSGPLVLAQSRPLRARMRTPSAPARAPRPNHLSRIEIQTDNPQIRIIWLVASDREPGDESGSSNPI